MPTRIAVFGVVLIAIYKSVLVRILVFPWGCLAAYDLYLSQFVPEAESKKYPRAGPFLDAFMTWMPLWGWVVALVGIFFIGIMEYVYKTHKAVGLAIPAELSPAQSAPTLSSTTHGANSPVTVIGAIHNSPVTINHGVNPADDSALGDRLEYSKWTTTQLKAETRKIVAAMRTLQLERDVQLSYANRIEPDESLQQRLARRAAEIGAIDAPILAKYGVLAAPNARAMFITLTFKLGQSYAPEPVDRQIGEQAITGYAVNGDVIKNGADYLEKLATKF